MTIYGKYVIIYGKYVVIYGKYVKIYGKYVKIYGLRWAATPLPPRMGGAPPPGGKLILLLFLQNLGGYLTPPYVGQKVPGKINRPCRKMRNEVLFSFAQVWSEVLFYLVCGCGGQTKKAQNWIF